MANHSLFLGQNPSSQPLPPHTMNASHYVIQNSLVLDKRKSALCAVLTRLRIRHGQKFMRVLKILICHPCIQIYPYFYHSSYTLNILPTTPTINTLTITPPSHPTYHYHSPPKLTTPPPCWYILLSTSSIPLYPPPQH